MFADLDETIRRLLIREVPLDSSEVDVNFEAPDRDGQSLTIDRAYVDAHLGELLQDPDLSRYIL